MVVPENVQEKCGLRPKELRDEPSSRSLAGRTAIRAEGHTKEVCPSHRYRRVTSEAGGGDFPHHGGGRPGGQTLPHNNVPSRPWPTGPRDILPVRHDSGSHDRDPVGLAVLRVHRCPAQSEDCTQVPAPDRGSLGRAPRRGKQEAGTLTSTGDGLLFVCSSA